jgi:1,4-alpha-glucan branching enzyme
VQDGINYLAGNTSVTLVLYAPNKTNVVAIGDFSNWQTACAYQMNRTPDGNRYWVTINSLTPGTIYRFQYLVDGALKTTDPYTELVLDPDNDQYISATTYPSLPPYPTGSTTGLVGTFQTNAPGYTWTSNTYTRPDKKNLVVYELLVRDFLANNNWQTLTDTLSYLKNLGVNAIEVMPFNEFEGNSSWGYNPDFSLLPIKPMALKMR